MHFNHLFENRGDEGASPNGSTRPSLVVLSNRSPYVRRPVHGIEQWSRTIGGLVSALDPALQARGGLWIAAAEQGATEVPPSELVGYRIVPVEVTAEEVEGHYRRVANGVLWPLLHSFATRVETQGAPWEVYRAVNERFAAVAAEHAPEGATFWVQDFQLVLVPKQLRARRPGARIGWFDHVPFPAPELFAMLPERREMLEGLLGADLLGFQTPRDARNFLAAVAELTPYPVHTAAGTVDVEGREVAVRAFPIGIDVDAVQTLAADPDVRALRERLRGEFGPGQVLLSVDRLDYTKGMPERLMAFATMLERHPELACRVSLVQVAVPSRTEVAQYARLKRQVDELVGQINGRFGRTGWTPIHYLYRAFDLSHLVALYGLADAAVITPLRDGMNLVAQEFVAARLDGKGVLLLSEFAGAATILDGAVLVNPYDFPRTADAFAAALAMPAEEQAERMRRMRAAVRKHRVGHWLQQYLAALEGEPASESHASLAQTGVFRRVG
jgi:alpha,alpha-trehalose-phosphate synthase [UDP-forming]